MEEKLSRAADFVLPPSISKEDLDLRARMAKYFSTIFPMSGRIANEIKNQNKELFANFDRLPILVEIYVGWKRGESFQNQIK